MHVAKGKYQKWLTQDGHTLLEAWARDGLTDEQISHNMGIATSTLYDWKTKYQEISDALKKGKEVVDIEVENTLLKRALGYKYKEEKIETDEAGGKKITTTTKEVVPDTTAQIFWLKNRKPEQWREKQTENQNITAEDDPITKSLKENFGK
jgi:transposase-like protein